MKDFGSTTSIYLQSDSNAGRLGGKHKRYHRAMLNSPSPSLKAVNGRLRHPRTSQFEKNWLYTMAMLPPHDKTIFEKSRPHFDPKFRLKFNDSSILRSVFKPVEVEARFAEIKIFLGRSLFTGLVLKISGSSANGAQPNIWAHLLLVSFKSL